MALFQYVAGVLIHLRRVGVGNQVFERLKTEHSEAPAPLTGLLADCLRAWHAETEYGKPDDWVFASKRSHGRKPRSAGILTADYLRPAALAAGVELRPGQRFGFHNFRHGLATFLANQGTDVKTVQGPSAACQRHDHAWELRPYGGRQHEGGSRGGVAGDKVSWLGNDEPAALPAFLQVKFCD